MFGYFLFQVSEIAELLMMNVQALGGIRADLQSIESDLDSLSRTMVQVLNRLDSIVSALRYFR